jgi:hypothetical protein
MIVGGNADPVGAIAELVPTAEQDDGPQKS